MKKIGELEGKPIVTDEYAPSRGDVIWKDPSDEKFKEAIDGEWADSPKIPSGGGSEFPYEFVAAPLFDYTITSELIEQLTSGGMTIGTIENFQNIFFTIYPRIKSQSVDFMVGTGTPSWTLASLGGNQSGTITLIIKYDTGEIVLQLNGNSSDKTLIGKKLSTDGAIIVFKN